MIPDSFLIDLTGFCMPTENTKITDIFGYRPRRRRIHYGLDVKVERGDTIRAAFDGKVRYVSYQRRGYGNYVVTELVLGSFTPEALSILPTISVMIMMALESVTS